MKDFYFKKFEEIAARGLLFYYSFNLKKACVDFQDDEKSVILNIPSDRFDVYMNVVKETLHFQMSDEKDTVFYPSNTFMGGVIKEMKRVH